MATLPFVAKLERLDHGLGVTIPDALSGALRLQAGETVLVDLQPQRQQWVAAMLVKKGFDLAVQIPHSTACVLRLSANMAVLIKIDLPLLQGSAFRDQDGNEIPRPGACEFVAELGSTGMYLDCRIPAEVRQQYCIYGLEVGNEVEVNFFRPAQ